MKVINIKYQLDQKTMIRLFGVLFIISAIASALLTLQEELPLIIGTSFASAFILSASLLFALDDIRNDVREIKEHFVPKEEELEQENQ